MNRLNKTECCFLILWVLFISEGSVYPDYLEVTSAAVVSVWSWKNYSPCIHKVLKFFYILVLQEYWVLTESRIPLKPVQGVRIVALTISSHEQTQ